MKQTVDFFACTIALCLLALSGCASYDDASTAPPHDRNAPHSLTGFGDSMIYVKGGTFSMGGAGVNAAPAHTMKVKDYYLGSTQVDVGLAQQVLSWALKNRLLIESEGVILIPGSRKNVFYEKQRPYAIDPVSKQLSFGVKPDSPLVSITWYGSLALCNALSLMNNLKPAYSLKDWSWDFSANGFRLPTEAEWEIAAKQRGKNIKYPWGNSMPVLNGKPLANIYDVTSYTRRKDEPYHPSAPFFSTYDDGFDWFTPVTEFAPNPMGFHDLGGNGQEWCYDNFGPYPEMADTYYIGPRDSTKKVLRDCVPWNDWGGASLECNFRIGVDPDDTSADWMDEYVASLRLARNAN